MTKLDEKFYPLRCKEWAEISGNLTLSELRVLYWLRTNDPYSNGININCAAIARDLSQTKPISRQTVSRAMKTLDRKDYIDLEIISANVKIRSKGIHSYPDDTDGTATYQGYNTVPSGTATHPEVRPHTPRYDTVPSGTDSYHLNAETQSEQGFQNSKNIKIDKNINTSLEGSEEEKSEISHQNAPDSQTVNNSSLTKSSEGLQKIDFSGAALNFNSANTTHWALDYDGEEPTPWLCEPRSRRNNIVFDSRFMEWHGQRWLEKFKKADLYEAIADFRSSLLNNPDKIEGRWQEYEASIKHYAGATATAALCGAKIPEKDQKHILRHQKALVANTVEELDPNNAIAPEIEAKLLPQSAHAGEIVGSLSPAQDPVVEAAIACGELESDRFSSGYWWNPPSGEKRRYFKSASDWLAEIEKTEVW